MQPSQNQILPVRRGSRAAVRFFSGDWAELRRDGRFLPDARRRVAGRSFAREAPAICCRNLPSAERPVLMVRWLGCAQAQTADAPCRADPRGPPAGFRGPARIRSRPRVAGCVLGHLHRRVRAWHAHLRRCAQSEPVLRRRPAREPPPRAHEPALRAAHARGARHGVGRLGCIPHRGPPSGSARLRPFSRSFRVAPARAAAGGDRPRRALLRPVPCVGSPRAGCPQGHALLRRVHLVHAAASPGGCTARGLGTHRGEGLGPACGGGLARCTHAQQRDLPRGSNAPRPRDHALRSLRGGT